MNYSGLAYTLGAGVASVGGLFVILSPFLGWVAVFLSGSDTSGNALFGNLQVVAARQLNLNPVLFAAANSSGGVMGKMISPQNIATGVSVTDLKGREGDVFVRTFPHSIVLTIILGLLVAAQQYLIPWIIPALPAASPLEFPRVIATGHRRRARVRRRGHRRRLDETREPAKQPGGRLKLAVAFALPNRYFRREIYYNDGAQSARPARPWETMP